jgi:hypothetical protein
MSKGRAKRTKNRTYPEQMVEKMLAFPTSLPNHFTAAYGVFARAFPTIWTGMFQEVQKRSPEEKVGTSMGSLVQVEVVSYSRHIQMSHTTTPNSVLLGNTEPEILPGISAVLNGPVSELLGGYGFLR